MAEKLNVDIAGLTRGSSDIGEQATTLSASHRQSMVGLSDAETNELTDAMLRELITRGKTRRTSFRPTRTGCRLPDTPTGHADTPGRTRCWSSSSASPSSGT